MNALLYCYRHDGVHMTNSEQLQNIIDLLHKYGEKYIDGVFITDFQKFGQFYYIIGRISGLKSSIEREEVK